MNTKRFEGHTPGPWRAYGTTVTTLRGDNDGPIAEARSAWVTQKGCEANAALIAAAPRLLAEWEEARTAIRGLLDRRAARDSAYRDAARAHAASLLARMMED